MAGLVNDHRLVSALRALRGASFDLAVAPALELAIEQGVAVALATGDAEELEGIHDELASLLASGWGNALEDTIPVSFDRLTLLLPRLAAASQLDVARLLDSYGGKPRAVLELLEPAGAEGLLQAQVKAMVGLSKDYLSKVVSRLVDADLVLRAVEGVGRRLVITATGRRALGTAAGSTSRPDEPSAWQDAGGFESWMQAVGVLCARGGPVRSVFVHANGRPANLIVPGDHDASSVLMFDFPNVFVATCQDVHDHGTWTVTDLAGRTVDQESVEARKGAWVGAGRLFSDAGRARSKA